MSQKLEQEGKFRGGVVDFALSEGQQSSSLSVDVCFRVDEYFAPPSDGGDPMWHDWRQYGLIIYGKYNLVGKDGTVGTAQKRNAEMLAACLRWNGDLLSIAHRTWQPGECQFVVKNEPYNGKNRFIASWLDPYDADPSGSMNSLSPERAEVLAQKYAGQFRAIAAGVKAPAAPPAQPAPAQSPAPAAQSPAPAAQPVGAAAGKADDIPY